MLINCGHQCVTGDYSWDGMRRGRHDMVIWQYTLAGMAGSASANWSIRFRRGGPCC